MKIDKSTQEFRFRLAKEMRLAWIETKRCCNAQNEMKRFFKGCRRSTIVVW